MNAQMRIQVTAEARQALQQLRMVRKELTAMSAAKGMTKGLAVAGASVTALSGQSRGLMGTIKSLPGAFSAASGALVKWGKNMQWAGRQLEFRVTLPILALGAASWKFAMDFEKSMTRVRKVYGDTSMSMSQVNTEVDKIQGGFISLSNIYGVHADVVADIGAVYAQAGAEGAALLEVTQATIQAMILGNLSLEESTKGIITIMDAYALSTSELTETLALLNVVENESPANMQDLITVIGKAGATARTAGVDIAHLAAMTAAMIPAAGNAAEVGNALKTVIQRIMSPTKQAAAALEGLGLNLQSVEYQSKNFVGRLEEIATAYAGLTQNQKLQFTRDVAQLRQGNRMIILLDDLISRNSQYRDILEKVGDASQNQLAFNRELQTYLTSAPQQWAILTNRLRNMLMTVMLPLLPAINSVVESLAALAIKFEALDPSTQKLILFGALALAALGPLVAYLGTFATVLGFAGQTIAVFVTALGKLGGALAFLAAPFLKVGAIIKAALLGIPALAAKMVAGVIAAFKALPAIISIVSGTMTGIVTAVKGGLALIGAVLATAPWWVIVGGATLALAALSMLFTDTGNDIVDSLTDTMRAIIMIFPRGIQATVQGVVTAINSLPRAFANMFRSLINVVSRAVKIVRTWLSYLNPFKRSSPSLVDNVREGVRVMNREFQKLTNAISPINRLASAVRRLGDSFAAAARQAAAADLAEKVRLAAIAGVPEDVYMGVVDGIADVEAEMGKIDEQIKAHEGTIRGYEDAMAGLQGQIEGHENTIEGYEDAIDAIDDTIKGHEQTIKGYEQELKGVEAAMEAQQEAIDGVQDAMDALDDTIEAETDKLQALQDVLSGLNKELGEAQSRLAEYRSTPIAGTYAFEDAIFANTQDANALKLQLALVSQQALNAGYSIQELRSARDELAKAQEEATQAQDELTDSTDAATDANDALTDSFDAQGASADDVRRRMALLAGEIEGLRGESLDLRLAGAGSDVLAGLDAQIGVIDTARRSLAVVLGQKQSASGGSSNSGTDGGQSNETVYGDSGTPAQNIPSGLFGLVDQADAIQRQLDKVNVQGEILNLQKGLALDPGNKAISDAFRVPEMSVGAILGGINTERANIAALEQQIAGVNAEIEAQEGVIEGLNQQRAVLEDSYDAEVEKLEVLQDQYDAIQDKIEGVEETIAGLNEEQAAFQDLIDNEQDAIDALVDQMDEYQDKIDEVQAAIDDLTESYEELEAARDEAQDTLDEAVDLGREIEAAEEAAAAAEEAAGGGGGGGGVGGGLGDFGVPGGAGGFETDTDLDELLEQLQKEADEMFDDIDIFGGIKEKWEEFRLWFTGVWEEFRVWFTGIWSNLFGGINIGELWNTWVVQPFNTAIGFFVGLWEAIEPAVRAVWDPIWENLLVPLWEAFVEIGGALGRLYDTFVEAFNAIMDWVNTNIVPWLDEIYWFFETYFGLIGQALMLLAPLFQTGWEIITNIVGSTVEVIGVIISGLIDLFGGIITFLTGVFTGDWGMAWDGIVQMATAIWDMFTGTLIATWDMLWDAIQSVWDNMARPFFEAIWGWLRDTLAPAIGDVWDFIVGLWDGMWAAMEDLWNAAMGWLQGIIDWLESVWQAGLDGTFGFVSASWDGMWGLMSGAWTTATGWLGGIGGWVTDNIAGPVNAAWEGITGAFSDMWSGIEGIWNNNLQPALNGIVTWFQTNIIDFMPNITDAFIGAFSGAADGIGGVWSRVTSVILGPLRGARSGINTLLSGLDTVATWVGLGGWSFRIPAFRGGGELPTQYAKGGHLPQREVGAGFMTNTARAIVGEGNTRHPEYVIPTDPKYRGRAEALTRSAANALGIPMLAGGGILGKARNAISALNSAISLSNDQLNSGGGWFGSFGRAVARPLPGLLVEKALKWITDAIDKAVDFFKRAFGWMFPGGAGLFDALNDYLNGREVRPRPVGTGTTKDEGYDTGQGTIYAAGGLLPLLNGGIVKGGRGGIAALIGEGRSDEAVIPLDNYDLGRTVNIYGDVSLPDVNDVDEFLANLESMAGS